MFIEKISSNNGVKNRVLKINDIAESGGGFYILLIKNIFFTCIFTDYVLLYKVRSYALR